jgi:hypothetical protein
VAEVAEAVMEAYFLEMIVAVIRIILVQQGVVVLEF